MARANQSTPAKKSAGILYTLAGISVALGVFALILGSAYGLFFGLAFGLVFYAVGRYASVQAGRPGVYGRSRQTYREVPHQGRANRGSFIPTDATERDASAERSEDLDMGERPPMQEEDVQRGAPFGEERRP